MEYSRREYYNRGLGLECGVDHTDVKKDFDILRNCCGPRVRQARRRACPRVSQLDLVARLRTYGLELTQATVSKIEHQRRIVTDLELKAIGEALAVRVGWLIDEEEL